ncbi:MAG: molybdopterin-synthase adenylyltransferase MoeB [Promethearchaeota archaeon]
MKLELNDERVERYSRQLILDGVGGKGQRKIFDAKVLVVGAGGLGAPAILYLAAAGVGTLGIADDDVVELSNLQRQVVHRVADLGTPKAESAANKVREINPDVQVRVHNFRVTASNARELFAQYDFVIDGTDNFSSKFLINDACVLEGVPFSHAGILRYNGQTLTHVPGSACYRCVFPREPPRGAIPSCQEAGVLGVVAGILGSVQAAEALKFVLGTGDLLTNRMLVVDVKSSNFRVVRVRPNPTCPVCGKSPTITELVQPDLETCQVRNEGGGEDP